MMLFKTMIERIGADAKGQQDHTNFKAGMVDDIDTKQGQAGKK